MKQEVGETQELRTQVLKQYGAATAEIEALLEYNRNVFDHASLQTLMLPLDDEPFVASWMRYKTEADEIGVFNALKKRIVQFNFPIQEGISSTEDYSNAVKKGLLTDAIRRSEGFQLCDPQGLELRIHQTPAGKIPVLITSQREDFVAILQALTRRNEPALVPASQGATMISGYNNWDRIWYLQDAMRQEKGDMHVKLFWPQEFKKILPQTSLYQDKCILLSRDYYSGVSPDLLDLDEAEWRELSVTIRLEHECAHYFTKRVLSSMRNNLLDELIADYAGITAAIETFRADWFLTFVGLERYPIYREGGRLENYRGTPALSDRAFAILQTLIYQAAHNLERYVMTCDEQQSLLLALTTLTLEELASSQSQERLYRSQKTCHELWCKS